MPNQSSVYDKVHFDIWITQAGDEIRIKELDMSHLLNIVALLYRRGGEGNAQRHKLVTLEKELMKRFKDLHNAAASR
jgi:hypothetical protein